MILRLGLFRHKVLLHHRVYRTKLEVPTSLYHNRLQKENIVTGRVLHTQCLYQALHQHRHRTRSRSFVCILVVPSHVVVLDSLVTLASTHLLRILT